jgi:hypothetical protein
MTKFLFLVLIVTSTIAHASAEFSAFTSKNILYVTLLGDCNTNSGRIGVSDQCDKNRPTRDYVIFCEAKLHIFATEIGCGADSIRPRVLKIDLSNSNVAPEAQLLRLNYSDTIISVPINK